MSKQYTIQELADIVGILRSENGCPWDREQTHNSLRPCMTEEAAELLAAIRIYYNSGDGENMQEELGDILLQVVMHAQIAQEEALFDLQDVINGISEKMKRRHPHVFGDAQAKDTDAVLKNWDDIKNKEKEGKFWIESPLREIPRELPALTRAEKVVKKAKTLYHAGKNYEENVKMLGNTVNKLQKLPLERREEGLAEALSDILICLSDLSWQYKLSQEQILTDRIENLIENLEPGK